MSEGEGLMRRTPAKEKGGEKGIGIKVAQLGKDLKNINIPKGTTVGEAIEQAGFSAQGLIVKVNGKNADLADKLNEGDIIVLHSKVKLGVTVARLGEEAKFIAVPIGTAVGRAITTAGFSTKGLDSVKVNGRNAKLSDKVHDGDMIVIY